jgi:hypothetical protein
MGGREDPRIEVVVDSDVEEHAAARTTSAAIAMVMRFMVTPVVSWLSPF